MEYKLDFLGRKDEAYRFELDTENSNIEFYVLEDLSGIRFDRNGDSMESVQELGLFLNKKTFLNKLRKIISENKPKNGNEEDCPICGNELQCAKYCGGHPDDKTATCPVCNWRDF